MTNVINNQLVSVHMPETCSKKFGPSIRHFSSSTHCETQSLLFILNGDGQNIGFFRNVYAKITKMSTSVDPYSQQARST